jgi:hypothetical protein
MTSRILLVAILAAIGVAAGIFARQWSAEPALAVTPPATSRPVVNEAPRGCLPDGDGFFRARLDGALQMKLDWSNARLECEGMPRPDGNGIRMSFRRERDGAGALVIVLGIANLSESTSGRALPANVTIIEENANRLFGTLGDDKCTVDELRQELLPPWRPEMRVYRVIGRGFCVEPARSVGGEGTVLMSTFDFAGQVTYETNRAQQQIKGPV